MFAVTDAFKAALVKSHTIETKAEVLRNGAVTLTLDAQIRGTVSVNKNALIRRQCSVVIADRTGALVPASDTDPLTVYGNELRLWRGIEGVPASTTYDLVPLGTFRINDVRVIDTDEAGLTIEVDGLDRADAVSRARFEAPYVIASGTNYGSAIQALVSSRVSGVTFDFAATTRTTGATIVFTEDMDPWEQAVRLAEAIGMDLYFDPLGVCTMRPEPDPETAVSVWTYEEGDEATILGVKRAQSNRKAYNGVVVIGESSALSSGPVRSVQYITTGAMAYNGPYGRVPSSTSPSSSRRRPRQTRPQPRFSRG